MTDFRPDDLLPENLERMARESEQSILRLTEMSDELGAITGTGESADQQVRALVDNAGGIQRITIDPRAMRMGSEELADHVTAAVRAAQADAQRQGEEMLANALGSDAARFPLDMDALQRQVNDIQESFSMSIENSLASIDRLTRRSDR
ncbi:YbaB/EbfC family nucleoid-associated protein [Nonomuraea sp. NPDC005983]|uniref:YbaB/EbfC family nucleoid-associated protein n=1 Tax=Nonomuraea sp. NPDC005983 TaxID=3155595 RepID=UPI00339EE04A